MNQISLESTCPKVKFLTVVWGKTYIKRFCTLSLPSFLAPGNLPALATSTQLEVVIMTSAADIDYFENNVSFQKLKTICPVRFVPIDDLITNSVYGVILTLAYARPIIECGDSMLETHFVFMNADFVLANGSLKSLVKHIYKGRSIVLGPSYRAITEELEPQLESMVNTHDGILDVPPRKLVGMALKHPHRTTVAKCLNQCAFSSSHPNQLFWQVDENTVLGRYFLIFMLCLKPERVMVSVNGYCDYSFIPDLCPSGDEIAMTDSDEFFMLELQSRLQETSMLKQMEMMPKKIAKSMQEWSTIAQQRAASYDIVFHAKDIPPQLADAKAFAREIVNDIRGQMNKPKSHQNHHYWIMGVETWREHRLKQGLSCSVPELAHYRPGFRTRFFMQKNYLIKRIKHFYAHSIISPYQPIIKENLDSLKIIKKYEQEKSCLILYDPDCEQWLENITDMHCNMICISKILDPPDRLLSNQYDNIVCIIATFDKSTLINNLVSTLSLLNPNGSLFIASIRPQQDYVVHSSLIQIAELFANQIKAFNVHSQVNMLLYFSHRTLQIASRLIRSRYRPIIGIMSIPMLFLSAAAAFYGNIFSSSIAKPKFVKFNIGITIELELFGIFDSNKKIANN